MYAMTGGRGSWRKKSARPGQRVLLQAVAAGQGPTDSRARITRIPVLLLRWCSSQGLLHLADYIRSAAEGCAKCNRMGSDSTQQERQAQLGSLLINSYPYVLDDAHGFMGKGRSPTQVRLALTVTVS